MERRRREAGQETASSDRRDHGIDVRQIFEDLMAGRCVHPRPAWMDASCADIASSLVMIS